METKNKPIDEHRCPLCKELNHCDAEKGDCWCFHNEIPIELQEQIPEEIRGKSCICKKCVESYLNINFKFN